MENQNETTTRAEKIAAQKELCDKNDYPHLAPGDGNCFRCHNNIYDNISLEKAKTQLIIGCPHCNYSYCS